MKRILFALCVLLIVALNVRAQEKPDSTRFKQLQSQFQEEYTQLQKNRQVIMQEESNLFRIQEQLTAEAQLLEQKKLKVEPKKDDGNK